jgi:thymidylate synthase (FAD)
MVKIIEPDFSVEMGFNSATLALWKIERAGRVCYKSEGAMDEQSAPAFVRKIINNGHHSVLEHGTTTVYIICDRGVSHELVRHRLASYSQESTRYVNYKEGITVIKPSTIEQGTSLYALWLSAMLQAEESYRRLIETGASPQEARSVLPNSLKTEIVVTANFREWRHIFKLRCSKAAHPDMRYIMCKVRDHFVSVLPAVFDEI